MNPFILALSTIILASPAFAQSEKGNGGASALCFDEKFHIARAKFFDLKANESPTHQMVDEDRPIEDYLNRIRTKIGELSPRVLIAFDYEYAYLEKIWEEGDKIHEEVPDSERKSKPIVCDDLGFETKYIMVGIYTKKRVFNAENRTYEMVDVLDVSRPVYNELSNRDKVAFRVHEVFYKLWRRWRGASTSLSTQELLAQLFAIDAHTNQAQIAYEIEAFENAIFTNSLNNVEQQVLSSNLHALDSPELAEKIYQCTDGVKRASWAKPNDHYDWNAVSVSLFSEIANRFTHEEAQKKILEILAHSITLPYGVTTSFNPSFVESALNSLELSIYGLAQEQYNHEGVPVLAEISGFGTIPLVAFSAAGGFYAASIPVTITLVVKAISDARKYGGLYHTEKLISDAKACAESITADERCMSERDLLTSDYDGSPVRELYHSDPVFQSLTVKAFCKVILKAAREGAFIKKERVRNNGKIRRQLKTRKKFRDELKEHLASDSAQ